MTNKQKKLLYLLLRVETLDDYFIVLRYQSRRYYINVVPGGYMYGRNDIVFNNYYEVMADIIRRDDDKRG